jgi:hypothetical protein
MADHYQLFIETAKADLAEITNRTIGSGEVRGHLDLNLTLALGGRKRDSIRLNLKVFSSLG